MNSGMPSRDLRRVLFMFMHSMFAFRQMVIRVCFIPTVLLSFIAFIGAARLVAQPTGAISGTVAGNDGALVSGAILVANRVGLPAASGRSMSTSNGEFQITGLPDGTYTICAADNSRTYLDPCSWSPQPPSAVIAGGKAVIGLKVVLKKGSALQVRVNDPDLVLDSNAKGQGATKPHLMVGVFTDHRTFQPLGVVSKNASGRLQEAVIPFDRSVSLHLVGRGISVTDEAGKPVDVEKGASQAVTHVTGRASPPLIFTVHARP